MTVTNCILISVSICNSAIGVSQHFLMILEDDGHCCHTACTGLPWRFGQTMLDADWPVLWCSTCVDYKYLVKQADGTVVEWQQGENLAVQVPAESAVVRLLGSMCIIATPG